MTILRTLCILCMPIVLCQCAANDDRVSALLVSPTGEQYEFYSCTQLVATMTGIKAAQKELKLQISRAGSVASVLGGYKIDYANHHGNFVAARNAARGKNCEISADIAVDEPL